MANGIAGRIRRSRHPAVHTRPQTQKSPSVRMGFFTIRCLAVYGGRPARHPPGRCCATFKSAPGGFVLLRRALTDRLQI
ncbi:hypothetical protein, partial [Salmonella enterica]|uniref:hypothetical protein n=1 Tax=Salmonella enterica TaxID=28901 RepID=UPI001C628849